MASSERRATPKRVVLVALLALAVAGPSQASGFAERQALSLTTSQSRQHFNGMTGYGAGWRGSDSVADIPLWWSTDTSLWLREGQRSWRVTAGPLFTRTVDPMGLDLELEGAVRLTYIERPAFGSENLGSRVHFASHAGLAWWAPAHKFAVAVRFEHVSNAGLSVQNPGVNFASVELRLPLSSQ